jgi:hypothetical protein
VNFTFLLGGGWVTTVHCVRGDCNLSALKDTYGGSLARFDEHRHLMAHSSLRLIKVANIITRTSYNASSTMGGTGFIRNGARAPPRLDAPRSARGPRRSARTCKVKFTGLTQNSRVDPAV